MLWKASNIPLLFHYKVTEKLEQMGKQDILEPVHAGGVKTASRKMWQRKMSVEQRLFVDLRGKVLDEDSPIPDIEKKLHNLNRISYISKMKFAIKSNLTMRKRTCAQATQLSNYSKCACYLKDRKAHYQIAKTLSNERSKDSKVLWSIMSLDLTLNKLVIKLNFLITCLNHFANPRVLSLRTRFVEFTRIELFS